MDLGYRRDRDRVPRGDAQPDRRRSRVVAATAVFDRLRAAVASVPGVTSVGLVAPTLATVGSGARAGSGSRAWIHAFDAEGFRWASIRPMPGFSRRSESRWRPDARSWPRSPRRSPSSAADLPNVWAARTQRVGRIDHVSGGSDGRSDRRFPHRRCRGECRVRRAGGAGHAKGHSLCRRRRPSRRPLGRLCAAVAIPGRDRLLRGCNQRPAGHR